MIDIVIGELYTSNLHIQNNGNKYVFNFGQIPLGFKLRLAQTVSSGKQCASVPHCDDRWHNNRGW